MSVPAKYYAHSIVLPDATAITQLTELSNPLNQQDLTEMSAGDSAPLWSGTDEVNPEISFGSQDLKQFFDALGAEKIAADLSGGNTDVYWQRGKAFNVRETPASTAHFRARMQENSMMYWTQISAQRGQNAEVRGMIVPIFDGTNDPIQYASGVALVGAKAVNYVFRNGPIYLNGVLYSTQGIELVSNPTIAREIDNGEGSISHVSVENYSPQLTFRTTNLAIVATVGVKGLPLTSASIYFRRRQKGGLNVANATPEHIKGTGTSGTIKARQISDAEAEVFVQFTKPNATTEPLTWSTASAITT